MNILKIIPDAVFLENTCLPSGKFVTGKQKAYANNNLCQWVPSYMSDLDL